MGFFAGFRSWSSVLQISTVGVQLELQLEFQLEFHKAHKNCSLVVSSRKKKENTYFIVFFDLENSNCRLNFDSQWAFSIKSQNSNWELQLDSNWTPTELRIGSVCYRFGCPRSPIWLSELQADFRWSPGVVWRHESVCICCPQKVRLLDPTKWFEMFAFAINLDAPGARSGSLRSRRISDLRKIVEMS